jgi:hypothetical protein
MFFIEIGGKTRFLEPLCVGPTGLVATDIGLVATGTRFGGKTRELVAREDWWQSVKIGGEV